MDLGRNWEFGPPSLVRSRVDLDERLHPPSWHALCGPERPSAAISPTPIPWNGPRGVARPDVSNSRHSQRCRTKATLKIGSIAELSGRTELSLHTRILLSVGGLLEGALRLHVFPKGAS